MEIAKLNRELVRRISGNARDRCLLGSKTDQYNGIQGVTYQHILKHDEDINGIVRATPEVLMTRNDELEKTNPKITVCTLVSARLSRVELGFKWDRLQFRFHLNAQTISVHRPFIISAFLEIRERSQSSHETSEGTLAYGRTAELCVAAADAILDALEEARACEFPGCEVTSLL